MVVLPSSLFQTGIKIGDEIENDENETNNTSCENSVVEAQKTQDEKSKYPCSLPAVLHSIVQFLALPSQPDGKLGNQEFPISPARCSRQRS